MYETPELDTESFTRTSAIRLYVPADFEGMRVAGRLVAEALDMITPFVVPGVTTQEIDDRIRQFTLDHGGLPACLGYKGYMKTVCTSINHVVCHGIPGDRVLKDGDIVNIDHTVIVDGWHGDSSRMYAVGNLAPRVKKLVDVTYDLADPDSPALTVSLNVSSDGGSTWTVLAAGNSGHIGSGVAPGLRKVITFCQAPGVGGNGAQ